MNSNIDSKDKAKEAWELIDFSYKKVALRTTYDIESMTDVFTLALIHNNALSIMFFGTPQFDDLTNERMVEQMRKFMEVKQNQIDMGVSSPDDLEYHVYRYNVGDKKSIKNMELDLEQIAMCQPLKHDKKYAKRDNRGQYFVEYGGWNSANYDLLMIIGVRLLAQSMGEKLEPKHIRNLSNIIISYRGAPWKLSSHIETETKGAISARVFDVALNLAKYSDGHLDWSKLAMAAMESSTPGESANTPGLKREMARFGKDIIFDDTVSEDFSKTYTDEDKNTLIEYNFNDVLGTKSISERKSVINELETRDILREMYPYTSARNTPLDKIRTANWAPEERDTTAARLSSTILIGPKRIRPKDTPGVSYLFPVPDENSPKGQKVVDLWEYIKSKEEFIHPYLDKFFTHFRGKDTRDYNDDFRVKMTQPVTKKGQINIPYYRDGKPTDAYIRVSTGGAHGSVYAGLHKLDEGEVDRWIMSDVEPKGSDKPTIDSSTAIHLDYVSYYPNLAIKIGVYRTSEGIDRMSEMVDYRVSFKSKALKIRDEEGATDEFKFLWNRQNSLKLGLNSPTGAGNTHKSYALLPVDNKTLAMRLVGNMLIWCLAQRFTQAGAYVIATNTDGIFVDNISKEEAAKITEAYVKDYGMDVDPEPLVRYINRDTSNRIEFEYEPDEIDGVGGRLRYGQSLEYADNAIGRNMQYPLIAANAALNYMTNKRDWLTAPYDRNVMREYIQGVLDQEWNPQAWYHVYVGTKSRRFTLNGERQQKIVRTFLTTDGETLGNETAVALKNAKAIKVWNKLVDHDTGEFTGGVNDLHHHEEDGSSVEWVDAFVNELETLDDLHVAFIIKEKGQRKSEEEWTYAGIERKKFNISKENKSPELGDFEDVKDLTLGYLSPTTGAWEPLKYWKTSALTGYPSTRGELANRAIDLEHFDKNKIDIDAYIAWAESLLDNWKVTGDIPDIGMEYMGQNDVVVAGTNKRRKTKELREVETLFTSIYKLPPNVVEKALLQYTS